MYTQLDHIKNKKLYPKLTEIKMDYNPSDTYTFIGIVGKDKKIYALDMDVIVPYMNAYIAELVADVDNQAQQFPLNSADIQVEMNMALKTNQGVGNALAGHFKSHSDSKTLYTQRNTIIYTNIIGSISSYNMKDMANVTKSRENPQDGSKFPELPDGIYNAVSSNSGWFSYFGNGTLYYLAKLAAPATTPTRVRYPWTNFISDYQSNYCHIKEVINANIMFSYNKVYPQPVDAWNLMPGYVPQGVSIGMGVANIGIGAIRSASQISLDDANMHAKLMTTVAMYPIKVQVALLPKIITNITNPKFLAEPDNIGYVRWMFTAYPGLSYDTSILPNAVDTVYDPGGLLAGLSAQMSIAQQLPNAYAGMQYVAVQTQRSCVFNNMCYTNTEFLFSDSFSYMYWFVPRFPYYVISKGKYGLCITSIEDYSPAVLWINSPTMHPSSDAMFPQLNCLTPEEYLAVDGFAFAKHKFFYDQYTYNHRQYLPPSTNPASFSEVLVGAYKFKLHLPEAYLYEEKVYDFMSGTENYKLSSLSEQIHEDIRKSQYALGINSMNKTGKIQENDWRASALDLYETVFAKGYGTEANDLKVHHVVYEEDKPSVLLSISTQEDILGSLIAYIAEEQSKYVINFMTRPTASTQVTPPATTFSKSFYTLVTLVDLNSELYKMASCYQVISTGLEGGNSMVGVGYLIVINQENEGANPMRYSVQGGVLGTEKTYRQMLFKSTYNITYDVFLRYLDQAPMGNYPTTAIDLPFGALNKTPRILKIEISPDDDPISVNIELNELEAKPTSIVKIYDNIVEDGLVTASKIRQYGKYILFHTHENLIFFDTITETAKQVSWPKPKFVQDLAFCHIGDFTELTDALLRESKDAIMSDT